MKLPDFRVTTIAGLLALATMSSANAQDTIKIGVVGPFTGPFATVGDGFKQGIESWLAIKGNMVGNRKIEVVFRDSVGSPTASKALAEELIVKDKVSILGGFMLTPESAAAAPVINEAKVPLLMFNAATPALIQMSPYFVRMGQNIAQPAELGAVYARENGKSRGYTAVADFAPGHSVEEAFVAKFTALGGTVLGKDRIPLNTVDFAPFAERVANANPEFLEVFIPPGAPAVGYIKALAARGLTQKLTIVGQGEAEDNDLHLFDDSVIGFHSIIYISSTIDNPENEALKKVLREKFGPTASTSSFTVGAYDGMTVAAKMISEMKGNKLDGDAAMKAIMGFSYKSPRGPVTIDPATRENIQNFYVRRVEKRDGKMVNVVIKTFDQVQPPPVKK